MALPEWTDPEKTALQLLQASLKAGGLPTTAPEVITAVEAVKGAPESLDELLGEGQAQKLSRQVVGELLEFDDEAALAAQVQAAKEATQENEMLQQIALLNYVEGQAARSDPFSAMAAELSPNVAKISEMRRQERRGGARELFQNLGLISKLRSSSKAEKSKDRRQRLAFQNSRLQMASKIVQAYADDGKLNKQQIGTRTGQLMAAYTGVSAREGDYLARKALKMNAARIAKSEREAANEEAKVRHDYRMKQIGAQHSGAMARIAANEKAMGSQPRARLADFKRQYPHIEKGVQNKQAGILALQKKIDLGVDPIGAKIDPKEIQRMEDSKAKLVKELEKQVETRRVLWNAKFPDPQHQILATPTTVTQGTTLSVPLPKEGDPPPPGTPSGQWYRVRRPDGTTLLVQAP